MDNWDPTFTPCYTPLEMLELGVFEGKYINVIKGLPKSWYNLPTVVKRNDPPNVELNKFKVKSRQPLSVWRKNGWLTKHSPYGWFQWYCLYYQGRRLAEEDKLQIKRWRSFVARHQAQIDQSGDKNNLSKRLKQRQALLQWGWDSKKSFTPTQGKKNLAKLGVTVSQEWWGW